MTPPKRRTRSPSSRTSRSAGQPRLTSSSSTNAPRPSTLGQNPSTIDPALLARSDVATHGQPTPARINPDHVRRAQEAYARANAPAHEFEPGGRYAQPTADQLRQAQHTHMRRLVEAQRRADAPAHEFEPGGRYGPQATQQLPHEPYPDPQRRPEYLPRDTNLSQEPRTYEDPNSGLDFNTDIDFNPSQDFYRHQDPIAPSAAYRDPVRSVTEAMGSASIAAPSSHRPRPIGGAPTPRSNYMGTVPASAYRPAAGLLRLHSEYETDRPAPELPSDDQSRRRANESSFVSTRGDVQKTRTRDQAREDNNAHAYLPAAGLLRLHPEKDADRPPREAYRPPREAYRPPREADRPPPLADRPPPEADRPPPELPSGDRRPKRDSKYSFVSYEDVTTPLRTRDQARHNNNKRNEKLSQGKQLTSEEQAEHQRYRAAMDEENRKKREKHQGRDTLSEKDREAERAKSRRQAKRRSGGTLNAEELAEEAEYKAQKEEKKRQKAAAPKAPRKPPPKKKDQAEGTGQQKRPRRSPDDDQEPRPPKSSKTGKHRKK